MNTYKINDTVYDIHYGKGIVTNIDGRSGVVFPVCVQFETEYTIWYTRRGQESFDSDPTLTFKPYTIPDEYFKRS